MIIPNLISVLVDFNGMLTFLGLFFALLQSFSDLKTV